MFQAVSGPVSVGKEDEDVRACGGDGTCHLPYPTTVSRGRRVMVLVPCHSPLVYPEEVVLRRRVTRHCLSNRYSLQIEIAATPTKQTVGTRANRYNLPIRPGLRVCTCKPCVSRCQSASRATIGSRGISLPPPRPSKTSPHLLPGPDPEASGLITNPRLEIDAND